MEKSGKYSLIIIAALVISYIIVRDLLLHKNAPKNIRIRAEFKKFCSEYNKTYKNQYELEHRY